MRPLEHVHGPQTGVGSSIIIRLLSDKLILSKKTYRVLSTYFKKTMFLTLNCFNKLALSSEDDEFKNNSQYKNKRQYR